MRSYNTYNINLMFQLNVIIIVNNFKKCKCKCILNLVKEKMYSYAQRRLKKITSSYIHLTIIIIIILNNKE